MSKVLKMIDDFHIDELWRKIDLSVLQLDGCNNNSVKTIVTTVLGLLIANIVLEKLKDNKKKIKFAKTISSFAKKQLTSISKQIECFQSDLSVTKNPDKGLLKKGDIPRMKMFIRMIEFDSINAFTLDNISEFKSMEIEFILNYMSCINTWKNIFTRMIDDLQSGNSKLIEPFVYRLDIKIFMINSYIIIMILSKIIKNKDDFKIYKDKLIKELPLVKNEFFELEPLLKRRYPNELTINERLVAYDIKIKELFTRVERLSKEFKLSSELSEGLSSSPQT